MKNAILVKKLETLDQVFAEILNQAHNTLTLSSSGLFNLSFDGGLDFVQVHDGFLV